MSQTINWAGQSGRNYLYYIHRLTPFPTFKALPGNYIFAKEVSPNRWAPLYIGETEDFSCRFDNHHKMDACVRNGATAIHVRVNHEGALARRQEESDLVARWKPTCNG